jgi:hypothetical protein
MKRLRKKLSPNIIRFYMCGEYGDKTKRPHYHFLIFGEDFKEDRTLYKMSNTGFPIYNSKLLSKLWTFKGEPEPIGHATVQNMTVETAAYCARYVMKKITGNPARKHYDEKINTSTGEITQRLPEYTAMSLKPGIGADWFSTYQSDVYPKDFCTHQGVIYKTPRYYDAILANKDPNLLDQIKIKRQEHLENQKEALTSKRLAQMEQCKQLQADRLIRNGVK